MPHPPSAVRCLLVDDDGELAMSLEGALRADGFPLLQVAGGAEAQALLLAPGVGHGFGLVVLADAGGPPGLELLGQLRTRDPLVPVMMLIAHAAEADRIVALDGGADDVMAKPFGLLEFVARCRALVRRSRPQAESPAAPGDPQLLEVGPLQMHRGECWVRRQGKPIVLTPKEFRLLECFLLQPGRALRRELLMAQVWGPDYGGDIKSIDVHVSWLRRKLEMDPACPRLLLTVRGVGYRLVLP